ncbi:HEAT repeat domain-containing protein [Actinomadura montaniterrae]|uniref:HEAT repeat domain-containing protein n=1 Tax=Actinomadura montaniterrae TaxID=1803903 RepID=A0A6L3VI42_9ACTN|nr:HEAT repeat domain-containing protein [Actinomadura montaniterrae]KAB2370412.1 HEAT repeat domain-containing protein [Actinomadura montaniterrae]
MTLLQGLGEIDWSALRHAYGSAEDVPGLLRAAAENVEAVDDLDSRLYHQGGFVCDAATAALPYLVELAAAPGTADRIGLLELLGRLVHEANTIPRVDAGWPDAWAPELPRLLALLDDPDVAVRRKLASTLSAAVSDADAIVPALRTTWDGEDDAAARLGLVLAAGELAPGCTVDVLPETLVWLRDLRTSDDPQLRLAAETAVSAAVGAQRPDLAVAVEALRGDIAVWRDVPWVGGMSPELVPYFGGGASRLLGWIAGGIKDDPSARLDLCTAFIGDADADRRIGAVRVAADLLSDRRSPVRRLLPGLAALATDESSAARSYAVHLLAALDEGDADLLAARLGDDAPLSRRGRGRISDFAAWGLAWRKDARCVPHLVERLAEKPPGSDAYYGPSPFINAPPAILHSLTPLVHHADDLLPAIRARMDGVDSGRTLARVLQEWGPPAAPAVPELVRLLGTEAAAQAAIAIGAIGPAAADAVDALRAGAEHPDDRVAGQRRFTFPWAFFKVTGDPAPLLGVADALLDQRYPGGDLRLLADLGAHGAAYADHLRMLMRSSDDWARTEAANAYHRVTGDVDAAADVLSGAAYDLARGEYLPFRWAALRYLADMGGAVPGGWAVREILDSDRRHRNHGGWRGFAEDRDLRAIAARLLG